MLEIKKEIVVTRMKVVSFVIIMMLCVPAFAENTDPNTIFETVISTYKSMETYKAEGTITSDIDTGGMKMSIETSFSIMLKKPNLYLISWTQKNMPLPSMAQSGAVWSDGAQPFLYMGVMNAYSKMGSDETALSSATGISGGAAFTIPSLFLSAFNQRPASFLRLKDPKIEKTEKIGEEDCYVISGASTISKKETFWISKSKYLIIKYSRSLEPPEGGWTMPEMTDEQLEESIRGMGQDVSEEIKQKMRDMIKRSKEVLKSTKMRGSSTELHVHISSPELNKTDFQFALPEGAVLKESLFGGVMGGNR